MPVVEVIPMKRLVNDAVGVVRKSHAMPCLPVLAVRLDVKMDRGMHDMEHHAQCDSHPQRTPSHLAGAPGPTQSQSFAHPDH